LTNEFPGNENFDMALKLGDLRRLDYLDRKFEATRTFLEADFMSEPYKSWSNEQLEYYMRLQKLDVFAFTYNTWLVKEIQETCESSTESNEKFLIKLQQVVMLHELEPITYSRFYSEYIDCLTSHLINEEMESIGEEARRVQNAFLHGCWVAIAFLVETIKLGKKPDIEKFEQCKKTFEQLPEQLNNICERVKNLRSRYQAKLPRLYPGTQTEMTGSDNRVFNVVDISFEPTELAPERIKFYIGSDIPKRFAALMTADQGRIALRCLEKMYEGRWAGGMCIGWCKEAIEMFENMEGDDIEKVRDAIENGVRRGIKSVYQSAVQKEFYISKQVLDSTYDELLKGICKIIKNNRIARRFSWYIAYEWDWQMHEVPDINPRNPPIWKWNQI